MKRPAMLDSQANWTKDSRLCYISDSTFHSERYVELSYVQSSSKYRYYVRFDLINLPGFRDPILPLIVQLQSMELILKACPNPKKDLLFGRSGHSICVNVLSLSYAVDLANLLANAKFIDRCVVSPNSCDYGYCGGTGDYESLCLSFATGVNECLMSATLQEFEQIKQDGVVERINKSMRTGKTRHEKYAEHRDQRASRGLPPLSPP